MDPVEKIAAAVLYEGYVLWPYRRSALKNQKRWTLGGVYPHAYSEETGGSDPWLIQTQCLVGGRAPVVQVRVRFLQVVQRQAALREKDGTLRFVDELWMGAERYLTWEEATEREITLDGLRPADLESPPQVEIDIPAGCHEEPLGEAGSGVSGAMRRSWEALTGAVEIDAEPVRDGWFRLTVRITNTTPWNGADRESTVRQAFISTHTILKVTDGEFVSLTDPPEEMEQAAGACENIKTWPVLAGEEGDRHTLLSSPIILYDYPRIAPESPGDLFDGGEIDQLLVLNILTLTDEEKEEMRASDPRAREILERTESLTAQDFMGLHGAIREFRMLRPEGDPFASLERPPPRSIRVEGAEVRAGSRVRLRPRAGGDIWDLALAGKTAVVESIEEDYEERIHLSVTVEEDPGRDLGREKLLGHRFFFRPEEVEPIE